jgi:hypothetical protein
VRWERRDVNFRRGGEGSPVGIPAASSLVVRFTPWRRGAQGEQVSLQRSYRLTLRVTPFLLTPETEPDPLVRSRMLGKDENGQPLNDGIAIRFDPVELHSLSYDENVDCKPDSEGRSTNPNYDVIDQKIEPAVYPGLATQHPFVVPTKAVTDAISNLGVSATIDGVNLGTDLDFKLGLHVKGAAGRTFDPQTTLSRFPNDDWAIDIDPALIRSAIAKTAASGAKEIKLSPNGDARVEFDAGGIIRVYQSVGGCGSGNIGNVYGRVEMQIARIGPDGPPPGTRYVLRGAQQTDFDARVKACLFFANTQIGFATPAPGICPMLGEITFKVSPTEWFYATALDTDNAFYLEGRSTLLDAARSAPSVPVCS